MVGTVATSKGTYLILPCHKENHVPDLVVHVHNVHLLKDELRPPPVLFRHLTNSHVRYVDRPDTPTHKNYTLKGM